MINSKIRCIEVGTSFKIVASFKCKDEMLFFNPCMFILFLMANMSKARIKDKQNDTEMFLYIFF